MNLIEELERTRDETLGFFEFDGEELEWRYGPGKWSVRELLHHLSDAETVLFDRIRRAISEHRPVVWAFDQDAWARSLGYGDRPLELSRDIYRATREGIVYYVRLLYPVSDAVEFVHSEMGIRTLKEEFEKVALHNEHHLRHIRKALAVGEEKALGDNSLG
jgi:hypothetical protein